MNILILAVFLTASQKNTDLIVVNNIYNESILIKNKNEVDSLIEILKKIKNKNSNVDPVLIDFILNDLSIISRLRPGDREIIFKLINNIFAETNKEAKNLDLNEFLQIESKIKKLYDAFGEKSFYVALFNLRFLIYKSVTGKNINYYKEIEMITLDYEKKFGTLSILTSEAYTGICIVSEKNNDWRVLKKNADKLLEINKKLELEGYDIIMAVSFLIKSNVMMGNDNEAIKNKDIIKPFVLESLDRDSLGPQFRIYSSMATVYARQNKLTHAIAMQEMAVAALGEMFRKDKTQAKEQAQILRDLLAKNREFTSMRNLEERFKLQPLPLQNGEK